MASPDGGSSIGDDVNASIGGNSCLVGVRVAAADGYLKCKAFVKDCYSTTSDGLLKVS